MSTIGLVFFCVGLGLVVFDPAAREFETLARLRVVSPDSIASRAIGETVFLEGRVGDDLVPGPDGFAAYVLSRWRRGRDPAMTQDQWERSRQSGHWSVHETRTPRLSIVDEHRSIRFVDAHYVLGPGTNAGTLPSSARAPEDRIVGLRIGDPVVVVGKVVRDPDAPSSSGARAIDADRVRLGSASAYLADARRGIGVERLIGWIFLAVGTIVLVVAGIWGRLWWKAVRVARSRGFAHKPRGHDA